MHNINHITATHKPLQKLKHSSKNKANHKKIHRFWNKLESKSLSKGSSGSSYWHFPWISNFHFEPCWLYGH